MSKNNMLFAIARSPEGVALADFARLNGLAPGWEGCSASVRAMVTGNCLDNVIGNIVVLDPGAETLNGEFLVHLSGPHARCVVNLATVLAMAAAYVRDATKQARTVLRENGRTAHRGRRKTAKSRQR